MNYAGIILSVLTIYHPLSPLFLVEGGGKETKYTYLVVEVLQ